MNKNKALSEQVKRKARIRRPRNGRSRCYANAWKVIEEGILPDATYVEGIAVSVYGLIREHGWLECQGEIIDPTWPEDDCTYFPALRFVGQAGLVQAQATPGMLECGYYLPIFCRFGWAGGNHAGMKAARKAAVRLLEATPTGPVRPKG